MGMRRGGGLGKFHNCFSQQARGVANPLWSYADLFWDVNGISCRKPEGGCQGERVVTISVTSHKVRVGQFDP